MASAGVIEVVSRAWILLALSCALAIAVDVARRPQRMWIMNLVWPITAAYAGPLTFVLYRRSPGIHRGARPPSETPLWRSALIGAAHCGAGCAIGDVVAEGMVFGLGLSVAGSALCAKFLLAFGLAYGLGIFFQFFSIAPMRGLGVAEGLVAAVKADTLSLIAFEVGMFGWMAVVEVWLLPGLPPDRWSYWLMMQVAMAFGVVTALPVNVWLIREGLKEAM